MKGTFCAAAVATLPFCGTVAPADAARKGAAKTGSSPASVRLECMKQYGAWYDAATKRWVMRAPYYVMAGRADAVDRCVAQRTGKPIAPVMREQTVRP